MLSIRAAEPAKPVSGSPSLSAICGEPLFNSCCAAVSIVALSSCAEDAGIDHRTLNSLARFIAIQVFAATTATAFPRLTSAIAPAGLAGKLATVPPIVGQ